MDDFFNNTATDQHDHHHGHGAAGSDVDTDDGKSSNSESTHDDEQHNHHNQEEETKEMKRTTKNSSAPILTGFALSLMFILGTAFNVEAFDGAVVNDGFNNDIATINFRAQYRDWNKFARSFKKADVIRFTDGWNFEFNGREFTRAEGDVFIGFRGDNFFDVDDTEFGRFDADPINAGSTKFGDFYGKNPVRFDQGDFINGYKTARIDSDNTYSFNADGFRGYDFVA